MSNVRYDMANMASLGVASVTINSATTTTFDFGTPDDLNLAALSGYNPGDRVLVILSATTAGTTNNLTWVVQDAADSSGSIGTPAAATLSAVRGALAAGTANDFSAFAVQVQPGRPWLRVKVTSDGATDTFVTHCTVWAVPNGV
jgi:hypothetical protein